MEYEYKTIIDLDGYIIDKCVIFIDNNPQYFILKDNQKAVTFYDKSFIKPKWNGQDWMEDATEEEKNKYEEEREYNVEYGIIKLQ